MSTLGAALLAAITLAAPARAATISPPGVRFPQIAVNAGGTTIVAWERLVHGRFAIEARAGAGPRQLGPVRRLAARGFQPRVAVGADGTRAVQWLEEEAGGIRTIRVAVARPGRGFGRGQVLYRIGKNVSPVGVVVQPDGRVVAVWHPKSAWLAYALAPRDRRFGHPRSLGRTGPVSTDEIALDPRDGAVVLAYGTPLAASPPANQQAAARTLAMTSTAFSAPVVLSDPTGLSESHPAVVTGSGGTGVTWSQTGATPAVASLRLARRRADGTWSSPEIVTNAVYGEGVFAVDPHATLPVDGSALATWSIATDPYGRGAISKRTAWSIALPSAAFAAPATITPADEIYGSLAVASAGADAFLATAKAHGPVILAKRSAGSAVLGPPRLLTADGDGDVLLAAAGSHVLAAWQQGDRMRILTVH